MVRMIAQDEIKKHIEYDRSTGLFIKLVATERLKAGDAIGHVANNGYISIRLLGNLYLAHRLAWLYEYGEFPKKFIDHIDGNRVNNKISNLRLADVTQNLFNSTIRKNNSSGVKGVFFDKQTGKWRALASIRNKKFSLGRYELLEDAKNAYQEFAKLHHGEFYREA